jgi:hypothetical protein
VDVVRCCQLDEHAGDDIGKQNGAFGDVRANKVESGGQQDHVENVVDEAW